MYASTIFCLQITESDIKAQVKWTVSLVIADNHFNPSQRYTRAINILCFVEAVPNHIIMTTVHGQ